MGTALDDSSFSREYGYLRYHFPRRFRVLSGFSKGCVLNYIPYTYALQRTIPSVRGSVTPLSLRLRRLSA